MNPLTQPNLDARGLPVGHELHPLETTPRETKALLDAQRDARARGDVSAGDFVLIDCRLPHEANITKIDGSELMPIQQIHQFADRLKQLRDAKVVVYCRSGGRSLQFAQILKHNGFTDARSMAGGILLWNRDVNPGGPQY